MSGLGRSNYQLFQLLNEPKTLARAWSQQVYQRPNIKTKQYCCQLKVFYKKSEHISVMFMPPSSPDLQYTHIVMIMMCCFGTSCIDDKLAAQHRTQQKRRPERTRHDQASSYKELCNGRATELYKLLLKNNDKEKEFPFHTFKHLFIFKQLYLYT